MTFNPCGMGVAYLADTVTDYIKPFRDSDVMVKRRWYPVPEGTPLLPFPTVFNSIHYTFQKWTKQGPGEVWGEPVSYPHTGTPNGLTYDHICGSAEDFLLGAVFDPDADVKYDAEWIPLCCGREDVCTTQLCGQDNVNGFGAAQLWSYPLPHQESDENTPVHLFQRAFNQGDTSPRTPGLLSAWFPAGVAAALGWSDEQTATVAGVPVFREVIFRRAPDEAISERYDANGFTLTRELGGVSASLTFEINGGVGKLCGVNATVCADLLPATVVYGKQNWLEATGNNQSTAAALFNGNMVWLSSLATRGLILPPDIGARVVLTPHTGTTVAKLYPPLGERFEGLAVDAPVDIGPGTALDGALLAARFTEAYLGIPTTYWRVLLVLDSAPPGGTVTSVDIGTSSAGLTVGGGPVTASGTLTVDLDSALEDLLAVAASTDLFTGDGAGGWAPVTIGDWLSLTGGTLDVIPVTATTGQTFGSAFTITAASGTFQATGITLSIPSAGAYLITGAVRGELQPSAAGTHFIAAKLRDVTNGADVANSETFVVMANGSGVLFGATVPVAFEIVTAGAVTIELYAKRNGTSFTTSQISSDSNGRTRLQFTRLA